MVRCHVCTQIEKEMLLVPEFDNLYAKRHKCEIASPNCLAWCNTTYLQNHNMQKMIFFGNMGRNIMAHMLVVGDVVRKRKMKFLQIFGF
jgi:hypothetical protein